MSDKRTRKGPMFGSIPRGDMPLDCGFGAEFIDIEPAGGDPVRVRVEDVPTDTIARSPDEAANAARAIQNVSGIHGDHLGFKIEYFSD